MFADSPFSVDEKKYNVSNYVQQVTSKTPRNGERKLSIRVKACLNCNGTQIGNINQQRICLKKLHAK